VPVAVERQCAADDAGVAAEAPFPETLAQNHDPPATGAILVFCERAAGHHRRPEEAEESRADMCRGNLLGIAFGEIDDADAIGGDILKGDGLTAPVVELGR
jgi:hypothetical protein